MVESRKLQCTPAVRAVLHSLAVMEPSPSPVGVQLDVPRQMHASYLIVQPPTLGAVHVVISILELLFAEAVMVVIVPGA